MKVTYDNKADALYIAFGEGPATVQEVAEGIALDWDSEGRLLGIEILDASKRVANPEVLGGGRKKTKTRFWSWRGQHPLQKSKEGDIDK